MRLDLFLKQSRLVIRRTLAQEMCDAGAVTVNNSPGKSGRSVSVGDTLKIRQRGHVTTVRILSTPDRPPTKAVASGLYEVLGVEDDPDAESASEWRTDVRGPFKPHV